MKKLGTLFLMAILLVSSAFATITTLSEGSVSMAYVDVVEVEFTLSDANGQQNIEVVIDPVCKDVDGNYGCGPTDDYAIAGLFSVTPNQTMMNDGDMVTLTLETTIVNEAEAGTFYYTVNGVVAQTTIGSETGTVEVPEFATALGALVLAGAGLFIYKKRK